MGVPVHLQSDLAVFHQFLLKLVQVERINSKGLHCCQSLINRLQATQCSGQLVAHLEGNAELFQRDLEWWAEKILQLASKEGVVATTVGHMAADI